jgi:hypothetical protein
MNDAHPLDVLIATDLQITTVPSGHICEALPAAMSHIARVAPRTNGRSTTDDIVAELLTGASTLWLVFSPSQNNMVYGVMITKIVNYPRLRLLNCYYCSGYKLSQWQDDAMAKLRAYAKDAQCERIEFVGRPGWLKALKKYGVQAEYHMYELELE